MASQASSGEPAFPWLFWGVMTLAAWLVAALWAGWLLFFSGLAFQADRGLQDFYTTHLSPTPERPDLICLGIDENSLSLASLPEETIAASPVLPLMRERFPWDRRVWAAAIDRLGEAGARVIIVDLLFTEPSTDAEADRLLAEAIARHRDKIVLASLWAPIGVRDGQRVDGMREPLEEFLGPLDDETAIGFVNFWPDEDSMIRHATYRTTAREVNGEERVVGEPRYDSLAAAAARKLGMAPPPDRWRLRFAADQSWAVHYDPTAEPRKEGPYLATYAYQPRSIYEIFVPEMWEMRYQGGAGFAGKVVLLGPVAPRFQDNHETPSGTLRGPQLHLQALGCLLRDSFWREPQPWVPWAVLAGMSLSGMLLVRMLRNPFVLLGAVLFLGASLMVACAILADRTGVLFTGFPGLLGLLAVTLSGGAVEFLVERARRKRLHRHLARSVSPDVADEMVRAPGGYFEMARGRRRKVVVLFSDVRGFTARSEQTQPEKLVEQLNEYFSRMVRIVFSRGGTLDKFIGDAVMATWGGLSDDPYETLVQAAVAAAEEMQVAVAELNAEWKERGLEPFATGIGIHFGEAVVGEIGSVERSDFTAIGDAVNVASRVEGLTKHLGVPVLLTGQAAAKLGRDHSVLPLGRFGVKGRRGVLELYTLASEVRDEESLQLDAALGAIESGAWDDAASRLGGLRNGSRLAGVSALYLSELDKARSGAVGDWNGVVRLDTK